MSKFWNEYLLSGQDLRKIRFSYCLNDAADLLVRIRLSHELINQKRRQTKEFLDQDSEAEVDDEELVEYSFYYYSAGIKNAQQGEYLFYDGLRKDMKSLVGVSMNEKYIFFWNLGSVWKLELGQKEISKLSLYISEKETHTFIKYVSTGSDPDTICIRVEQSATLDFVIYWEIDRDREIESFDVD